MTWSSGRLHPCLPSILCSTFIAKMAPVFVPSQQATSCDRESPPTTFKLQMRNAQSCKFFFGQACTQPVINMPIRRLGFGNPKGYCLENQATKESDTGIWSSFMRGCWLRRANSSTRSFIAGLRNCHTNPAATSCLKSDAKLCPIFEPACHVGG